MGFSSYRIDGIFVMLPVVIVYAVLAMARVVCRSRAGKRRHIWRETTLLVFVIYAAVSLSTLLFPLELHLSGAITPHINMNLIPLASVREAFSVNLFNVFNNRSAAVYLTLVSVITSVVVYALLGFFAAGIWTRFRTVPQAIMLGLYASVPVEILQFLEQVTGSSRAHIVNIDDVIFGVIGCILGVLLFQLLYLVFGKPIELAAEEIAEKNISLFTLSSFRVDDAPEADAALNGNGVPEKEKCTPGEDALL